MKNITTIEAADILQMRPTDLKIGVRDGLIDLKQDDTGKWDRQAVHALARKRKAAQAGWGNRCARAGFGGGV